MIKINTILSIIIVNHHVDDLLHKCILSINRSLDINYEIIIIDNEAHNSINFYNSIITVLPSLKNLGFAKANNIGINISKGKYILLLNPDTVVFPKTLLQCLNYMERNVDIGILGCKLLNHDKTLQSSCRNFPSLIYSIIENIGLHKNKILEKFAGKSYLRIWAHDTIRKVDSIKGAFFLIRKDVIDQIGLLDEKYFMYSEEVDYCKRVFNKGWNIVFYPHAQIIHYGGKSTEINSLKNLIELHRSQRYYYRKHMSDNIAIICISLCFLGLILRILINIPLPWQNIITRQAKMKKATLFYYTAKSYLK